MEVASLRRSELHAAAEAAAIERRRTRLSVASDRGRNDMSFGLVVYRSDLFVDGAEASCDSLLSE